MKSIVFRVFLFFSLPKVLWGAFILAGQTLSGLYRELLSRRACDGGALLFPHFFLFCGFLLKSFLILYS